MQPSHKAEDLGSREIRRDRRRKFVMPAAFGCLAFGELLYCRAWQCGVRASVGDAQSPIPGVYIQIFYVDAGERALVLTREYPPCCH